VADYDTLRKKGVDVIVCTATNDPYGAHARTLAATAAARRRAQRCGRGVALARLTRGRTRWLALRQ
jgi:hypothetical protein